MIPHLNLHLHLLQLDQIRSRDQRHIDTFQKKGILNLRQKSNRKISQVFYFILSLLLNNGPNLRPSSTRVQKGARRINYKQVFRLVDNLYNI